MSALVDLLCALRGAPRQETKAGVVLIFDAERTREVADAIERLDAQMSADLCNLDGFAQLRQPRVDWSPAESHNFDGIQRGNSDLADLTPEQLVQGHEAQDRG